MSRAGDRRPAGFHPRRVRDGGHCREDPRRALRDHRCRPFHAHDVARRAAVAAARLSSALREKMKVKANGIDFNIRIDGEEDAPWLVFSNSLATDLSMWDEQVAALKKDFRILRYDQRGHGGTDAPPLRYTFDTLVDDVVALYDELSIPRAHFVGLSMGGMTALGVAQRYTDRVDRLVVCDCTGASTPAGAQQWEERIAIAAKQGMEPLVEPTIGRWFPP